MRGSWPCIARQAHCAAILPGGASHDVFDPEFCNPAAGWEKGQVEKSLRDARHHAKGVLAARHDAKGVLAARHHAKGVLAARRLWQVAPVFPDLAALNC